MLQKTKEKRRHELAVKKALEELGSIQMELDHTYARFNMTTDPSLQDAYIYEISALRARYNHAVGSVKNLLS
jgi:hypothetical protein